MNAWRTPKRVVAADCPDQIANVVRYRRPADTASRLPAPVETETAPMPPHQRLGSAEQIQDVDHPGARVAHCCIYASPDEIFGSNNGGFCGLDHMLWATHRVRRIGGDDLARDQPVGQHWDPNQVLLDRRLLEILAKRLDLAFNRGAAFSAFDRVCAAEMLSRHRTSAFTRRRIAV